MSKIRGPRQRPTAASIMVGRLHGGTGLPDFVRRQAESSGRDRTALSWNFLASSGFAGESTMAAAPAPSVSMAFKFIESARPAMGHQRTHLVALVRAGALFNNGKLIERPDGSEGGDQQVA
jgi:hypothetical protein